MNIKTDVLTMSRVLRMLRSIGIDNVPAQSEQTNVSMLLFAALSIKKGLLPEFLFLISHDTKHKHPDIVLDSFLQLVSMYSNQFNDEINNRKAHAREFGHWSDDTEEDLKRKEYENANMYDGDRYFACYEALTQFGVSNIKDLTLYECMMLAEDFMCEKIKSGIMELCAMIEDDAGSLSRQVQKDIKHVHFVAGLQDYYDVVSNKYEEIRIAEKSKRK